MKMLKASPQGNTAFSKLQVDETPGCFYSSENMTYLQTFCSCTINCCNTPWNKFGACQTALLQIIPELETLKNYRTILIIYFAFIRHFMETISTDANYSRTIGPAAWE